MFWSRYLHACGYPFGEYGQKTFQLVTEDRDLDLKVVMTIGMTETLMETVKRGADVSDWLRWLR